jgi:signal transduction histidine kinase
MIDKWQDIVDLEQRFFKSRAVLITMIREEYLQVLLTSRNHDNPYESYYQRPFGLGSYCETVIGTGKSLYIENASLEHAWAKSPDASLDMIHYYGAPLRWPNGDVFGTICLLNHDARQYSENELRLFDTLRQNVEKDLALVKKHDELDNHYRLLKDTRAILVDREKDQLTQHLVSSISHEISTPLGVALTTSSYLDYAIKKSDQVPIDSILEGASLVEKNIKQAAKMLKSFKNLGYHSHIETIDLYYYIHSLLETLSYDFKKHKVDYKLEIDKSIRVRLDTGSLSQLIINLVLNAVYHAFKDCEYKLVEVKAFTEKDKLHLIIKDNGIGIEEENKVSVFEPFVRYDDQIEGTGLGLTIVKEIVEEKLKGKLSLKSDVNVGTEFKIIIPLEVSDENN